MQRDDDKLVEGLGINYHSVKRATTKTDQSKSLIRFQNPSRNLPTASLDTGSSTSKAEHVTRESISQKLKGVASTHTKVDCWRAQNEVPKLVEIFKGNKIEEEEPEQNVRKHKLSPLDDNFDRLSYTQEFHILTEVQKERILSAVEDTIKKLANTNVTDFFAKNLVRCPEDSSLTSQGVSLKRHFCKKFLLSWVYMKILEIIICQVIQLTFLSTDLYFRRKSEFIPVVAAYYFTLFIIILSLIVHVSCYGYVGFMHPCYFVCVISTSILGLITTLGLLIILCSMKFYKSFREILVLVFIGSLLCVIAAELCICYIEVKNYWYKQLSTDQCDAS